MLKHHNTQSRKQYRHKNKRARELAEITTKAKVGALSPTLTTPPPPLQLLPPDPCNTFRPIQEREFERREHCNSLPMQGGYDEELAELNLPCHSANMLSQSLQQHHQQHQQQPQPHRQHSVPIDFCLNQQELGMVEQQQQLLPPQAQSVHLQHQQQPLGGVMFEQGIHQQQPRSYSNTDLSNTNFSAVPMTSSSLSCASYPLAFDLPPNPRQTDPMQQQQAPHQQQHPQQQGMPPAAGDMRNTAIGAMVYPDYALEQMGGQQQLLTDRPMSQPNMRYGDPAQHEFLARSSPGAASNQDLRGWYPQ